MDKNVGYGLLIVGGIALVVGLVSWAKSPSETAAPEPTSMPDVTRGRGDSTGDLIAGIGEGLGSLAGGVAGVIRTARTEDRADRQQAIDREERAAERAAEERRGGSSRGR